MSNLYSVSLSNKIVWYAFFIVMIYDINNEQVFGKLLNER